MAHAYKSLEDGQIVVSDEPREDLEVLARWESIPVPEKADEPETVEIPEGEPKPAWKVDQLKAYAEREGIDLEGAKGKDEILAAVTPKSGGDSDGDGNAT